MPKEYSRLDRISDMIQRELSRLIQSSMDDPRVGIVTVSHVDVSPNLSHAKVHVSVLGDEAKVKETLKVLNKAAPYLRCLLAENIELRVTPELRFVYDDSIARASRISTLLNKK